MPKNPGRPLAAHVQAVIAAAAQPKKVDEGSRPVAPHVQAAIGAALQPQRTASGRPMATHVQAAIATAQAKRASPGVEREEAHARAAMGAQSRMGVGAVAVEKVDRGPHVVRTGRHSHFGALQRSKKVTRSQTTQGINLNDAVKLVHSATEFVLKSRKDLAYIAESPGGWEGWLQAELYSRLKQMKGFGGIQREALVYGDARRADLVIPTNQGQLVVELKAKGLFRDPKDFQQAVKKDIKKLDDIDVNVVGSSFGAVLAVYTQGGSDSGNFKWALKSETNFKVF